ncbi:hypothetical protein K461DRAFT_291155 [Myriangium duriaei CBS 260.36]|uniref:Rhodopsin domain-containing protein n=1 Tax=Myriangium duriaei CBS 260.36 TaxID=1168546 RepID=A0A9P4JC96_9PEZI|nr:hypothetical protein K461DRAFT_291155 [Myriangium duriaei CBS 260.36]
MSESAAPPPGYLEAISQAVTTTRHCDVAFLILALIPFAARVFVRAVMSRRFGLDDWLMCIAMLMYTCNCGLDLVQNTYEDPNYTGKVVLSISTQTTLARLVNFFYAMTVVSVKLSIGVFFLNIFTVSQKIQRGLIYGLMGLATASGITWSVMIMATCGINLSDTICPLQTAFSSVSITWSVLNAVSDLVFTSLAVQALWRAQLKPYVKLSAMALLCFACVGGAISIIRVVANIGLLTANGVIDQLTIGRWSTIERGIYITTACLVTLRPLLQRMWHVMMGSSFVSSGQVTSATTRPKTMDASQLATTVGNRGSVMVKKNKAIQQVTTIEITESGVKAKDPEVV